MSFFQLFLWQLVLGSPVYAVAAGLQGMYFHRCGYRLGQIIMLCAFSLFLAVCGAVIVWGQWRPEWGSFMWLDAVNQMALIACACVYPAISLLLQASFSPEQK